MSRWTQRVQGPPGPQELMALRAAARDLGEQATKHAPAGSGPVFQKVASIAFLGTAIISGTLAFIHLCKALLPRHSAPRADHPPEHEGREQHARQHHEPHHHTHGHHGRG